jgi:glutathione synthase/RimK-type ligase-like ATP-grasp enzyme
MKEIALATYKEAPKLADGEQLLCQELKRRGYAAEETPWDGENVNWIRYDQVILRATWNYHTRLSQFSSWLEQLKKDGVNLWNPIEVLRWNTDKHYLKDLEEKGVAIIPTVFIDRGQDYQIERSVEKLKADEIVVKPTVGASAFEVSRFLCDDIEGISGQVKRLLTRGDVMLQRYMKQVATTGEYSLMFFNKKFSHAVIKRPAVNDFRTQPHFGGSEGAVAASADLIAQAQSIVDTVESPLLYARVDGVVDEATLRLMELELVEPYLFFEQDPGAAGRFIEAMEQLGG